ncbi:hypothetical protein ACN4C7_06665 [Corynebacterium macclintockiae]|uniref:hypothetical protein n=1 Tax=Corynebacterium macclintockiae TaxID=2913501 RepID=UPI003EBFAA0A
MKVRKTLAVGIAAASISAGVAAPAQAAAPKPALSQQAAKPAPYSPITGSLRMAPILLASPIVLPAALLYAIWVRLNPGLG